ncbi:MAG: SCO family protein [Chthoniobacter sp.]|nr:SCO family protein [Chthoniobacter sp.]
MSAPIAKALITMPRRILSSVIALGLVAVLPGCGEKDDAFEMMTPPATPAALLKHWSVPDFTLTERTGQPVKLADLAGKVWVADFFYTACPGPCPTMSSRLSEVQKQLGTEPGLRLVSISIDPEKDTPAVLKLYAEKFQANDRWLFLTGPKADIYNLARDGFKLPIAEPETPGGQIIHSTRLVLIDQTGTIRGFYEAAGEAGTAELIRDIRKLLTASP